MDTPITEWFKSRVRGFSFNSAAENSGISVSTVRRHLTEEGKGNSAQQTIVTVCRRYNLNPVEGLIISGLVTPEEVQDFVGDYQFSEGVSDMPLSELIERIRDELDQLELRAVDRRDVPLPGQMALDFSEPDYSNMSEADARDYGLAAKEADPHIEHDEPPHQP